MIYSEKNITATDIYTTKVAIKQQQDTELRKKRINQWTGFKMGYINQWYKVITRTKNRNKHTSYNNSNEMKKVQL